MYPLIEAYDSTSAKDGGFVFQAVVSHNIVWNIINGETHIDPKQINAVLHTLDIFPDVKLKEGSATSTYVLLSEVNILKRKFEMASEAIKKRLSPEYSQIMSSDAHLSMPSTKLAEINQEHFGNTKYTVTFTTDHLTFREVSTSGLDSGSPKVTLKASTGMVDTYNGAKTRTWEAFKVVVSGNKSLTLGSNPQDPISAIREFDNIENQPDVIFRTILPSLVLAFSGDQVAIETYSNRSSQVAAHMLTDFDTLFDVRDGSKPSNESPQGEDK